MESTTQKKDLSLSFKHVVIYLVALAAPLLTLIGQRNESMPWLSFVIAVPAFGLAGLLVSKSMSDTNSPQYQWIGWSVAVGAVEAALISFAI